MVCCGWVGRSDCGSDFGLGRPNSGESKFHFGHSILGFGGSAGGAGAGAATTSASLLGAPNVNKSLSNAILLPAANNPVLTAAPVAAAFAPPAINPPATTAFLAPAPIAVFAARPK